MLTDMSIPPYVPRYIARKFANLVVVGDDEKSLHGAIDFLVQQVLLDKGAGGLRTVRKNFEEFFLLKFEREEIAESLKRLVAKGDVTETQGVYALEIKREGSLKKLNGDTKKDERQIYHVWMSELLKRYPELIEKDQQDLIDDLKVYLYRLFLKNGAECIAFVNPARGISTGQPPEQLFSLLPQRSKKIADIRKIEFPRFLKDADTERRVYFASLLDGTFIYQIIQIDPETLKLVKANFRNYVLYLDTNILYSLLGLRDLRQSSTIEKSLSLARGLGIKFVVSQKTVEEMRSSIEFQTEALLKSPPVRRDLAEIGADISEEESLTTAYWRAYSKTAISKEDFIERFRNLPDLLSNKQISIVDDSFRPERKFLRAEKEALNRSITVKKSDNIAEHDAYHRLLIQHLRAHATKTNGPKKYWFFSWDNQLAIYANKVRKQGEISFMYLPHQLVQILRLYTQRTPDYDETFLELFSRPQIKSAQNVVPNDFAEKVLAKVSSFADLPEELAVKIMLDSAFISKLTGKSEPEISKEIQNEVDTRTTEQLKDLTNRIKELEEKDTKRKTEQDDSATSARSVIGGRDRTIRALKTWLFVLALLCLVLVNAVIYLFYLSDLPIIARYALVGLDIALLVLCFWIRWTFDKSFYYFTGIAGLIGLVVLIVPFLPLKKASSPAPSEKSSATSTDQIEIKP